MTSHQIQQTVHNNAIIKHANNSNMYSGKASPAIRSCSANLNYYFNTIHFLRNLLFSRAYKDRNIYMHHQTDGLVWLRHFLLIHMYQQL